MISLAREVQLSRTLKATVTPQANGATQIAIHTQRPLLTFRVVPDSPTGLRLERFQPEEADPRLPLWFSSALLALLARMDWQYIVALYPSLWQERFAALGFRLLNTCIHWRISLESRAIHLPEGIQIRPITMAVERLGQLMSSAENNPLITPARATRFCQTLLDGAYGLLIPQSSCEISVAGELAGACLFTDYYGEALHTHIFIEQAMQGRGLAGLLLPHCLNSLYQAGYPTAIASTDLINLHSRRLHARVGFTQTGSVLNCGMVERANWKDGGV